MLARIAVAFAIVVAQFAPVPAANAVEPLTPILSCSTNPGFACIEKINVISADGEKIATQISTTRLLETRTYAPSSVLNANWQFYDVPGIKLAAGFGGRFLIRPFYFPAGNLDCFYTPCQSGGEYLEFAVGPITFDGISNLKDLGYSYEIFFRVPENFLVTASTGRGIKVLDISRLTSLSAERVAGFKNYKLLIEPVAFSSFKLDELLKGTLIEKASEESDNGVVWISGANDSRMISFGKCKNLESMSVTGNAFFIDSPTWNPKTLSIEVLTRAPHLKSDGSKNIGYFQAKVSTDMARCLWGIDLSKTVEANISLNYENGEKVQIETWNGKLVGNDYVLTASGFHFSSPKISFKLTEEINSATNSSPIATPKASLASQVNKVSKTITCVKGKITKKVVSVSPKCPIGYKKKS